MLCGTCVRTILPCGCEIDKKVSLENNSRLTDGYCGFKEPTGKYLFLSLIILLNCDCISKLQKTLGDLSQDKGFVKQIIITCTEKVHSPTRKTIIEVMKDVKVDK